jgi:membrane protein
MKDNAMRLSAALSLYTMLSLAPLLVITLKVIGMVWRGKDTARELISRQMTDLMGPQAADAIKPMLENSGHQGHGVLAATISIAVLFFSAAGVFGELQDDMNLIWGVEAKPNQGIWGFVHHRLLSIAMVLGIAFLLLVSMFVSTILAATAKYMAGDSKLLLFMLDVVVSFGVVTMLFAAIFKFLPDAKVPWRYVWLGAVMTALLFTAGKYGLTVYFKFAAPTSAFGAAGSLAAVMLWIYYSSFILFFGAEFTKVWALRHGHGIEPSAHAEKAHKEKESEAGKISGKPLTA